MVPPFIVEICKLQARSISVLTVCMCVYVCMYAFVVFAAQADIMAHLQVSAEGLLSMSPRRDNLQYLALSVEGDDEKRKTLVDILKGGGGGGGVMDRDGFYQPQGSRGFQGGQMGRREGTWKHGRFKPTDGGHGGKKSWQAKASGRHRGAAGASGFGDGDGDRAEVPLTIVYVWRRDEAESLGEFLSASGEWVSG